jgi:(1->4)-alpha-D-glucan 1-alpha-D-glucosylmutase
MTASTHTDPLLSLARHCGLTEFYSDIYGTRHVTPEETRRALLAAMGIDIEATPPEEWLQRLEDDEWRNPLPPVCVIRCGEPPTIRVSLPGAGASHPVPWSIELEDGQRLDGQFVPAELPAHGRRRVDDVSRVRRQVEFPPIDRPGYHRLKLHLPDQLAEMSLIVAPDGCYRPDALAGEGPDAGRVWGPAVQLYSLRSRRNWGIGDFTDLHALVDMTAEAGGGIVGLNPLHALFPHDPARISPYSPSSRSFFNALYIDVEAIPELHECLPARALVDSPRFQARLRSLRAEERVNYPAVAAAKREVLDLVFRHFRDEHIARNSGRAGEFNAFRAAGGDLLESLARYEALQAYFCAENPAVWGWPVWPAAFRDPQSPEVAEFAAAHAEAVAFHAWLQWLAASQLDAVGHRSWQRGLGVGLYGDLAVGVNPGGAEAWRWQDVFARGAYAGAPPDLLAQNGQDWGLPPFIPHRLRQAAYAPLIEILRANMRYNGALRIDHVMGLYRVFWVPAGQSAANGAYVHYPVDELLGIVALESQRNRCVVIGEDLGTVPEELRPQLAERAILSYRPLIFERQADGVFTPPADYPRQALACVSTHDLPTLAGLWQGLDIDLRAKHGLYATDALRADEVVARAQDRARLLMALEHEQLLPEGASVHPVAQPEMTLPLAAAVHAYLARTPSMVLMVQAEDILGLVDQANLPSTRDDQHPNWQRRLPLDLEEWSGDARFQRIVETLRHERGTAVTPHPEPAAPLKAAVIPRATYRLQFNRDFTFAQATELVPYLAELGISHCYASPYLKARPGSGHGYDIVDHTTLNPEIGTPEDFERFVETLHAHGMGQILDIVPNHMGIMGADNAWWLDVLENGPASAWGRFFDIDWNPLNPALKGKILLPLLGEHYGTVLNRGELRLAFDAGRGEFSLFYYEHRLPIDPATYPHIIGHRLDHLGAVLGETNQHHIELLSLLTAFSHLPGRLDDEPARQAERQRDKEVLKRQLAALCAACADIATHIDTALAELNGTAGDPASFDLLHELIQAQGYRLAFWRVASDEINYRRFFDINDLAALRMEEPAVFEATHRFVLDLVAHGKVDGLRIDHPDGLYDPGQYFRRLQEHIAGRPLQPDDPLPAYLVIEKILADHERLPEDWTIHGGTGYRFSSMANSLFVDPAGERRITRIYRDFIGRHETIEAMVHDAKGLIMDTALASELAVLANRLTQIAAASRDTCDFTLNSLREALAEVVACFPVYRTYVGGDGVSADDRRHIDWAIGMARKRSLATDLSIFDFIAGVLTTDIAQGRSDDYRARVVNFAMKFQQFSSPVKAKGLEDTTFYRYHRLASLNEVGSDPRRFGMSVNAFHASTKARAARWPHNMLATSTHDSKRSEDVRARLNVLAEIPAAWKLMLRRWSRLNRLRKRRVDGATVPSANDEYLLYQTLIGTWPSGDPAAIDLDAYRQRIVDYMIKAVREAKEHSSWVNVNASYERGLEDFITALLAPIEKNPFLADFIPVATNLSRHGYYNGLAMTLLKLTSPGVPDIYQGCELWQFNLVDPDNRRPVDFNHRHDLLRQLHEDFATPEESWPARLAGLMDNLDDSRLKLYITWRTLQLRAASPELFARGDYLPLDVSGTYAEHVCAYARTLGEGNGDAIITVVPRLTRKRLGEQDAPPTGPAVWDDTVIHLPESLAGHSWRDVLCGTCIAEATTLAVGDVLATLPVGLLKAQT